MHASTLLLFAAVAFVIIATPGPTVLLALTNGSRHGLARAACGMAGAVASDFVLVAAAALGLGALLAASEFWFGVVKWLGVAYLAFLGVMMLRSSGRLALPAGAAEAAVSGRALFMRSFLVAITNPKGYLFVSAFLPQFVAPQAPQWPQYVTLALVFALTDLAVMAAYALAGARVMRFLKARGALWLDRTCGATLLALAGSLAWYRRAGN
ncbi:MAG TPA: LysE family translocator [Burkholderiales bacterium]|jgi:threonine/homoserine/homoserine lactone efflux protein|nr:LysE family translocator [Burkholderiales bacterium]